MPNNNFQNPQLLPKLISRNQIYCQQINFKAELFNQIQFQPRQYLAQIIAKIFPLKTFQIKLKSVKIRHRIIKTNK